MIILEIKCSQNKLDKLVILIIALCLAVLKPAFTSALMFAK